MTTDIAALTIRYHSEARSLRAQIQQVRAMTDECLARDAPAELFAGLRRQRLQIVSRLQQLEGLEMTIRELKGAT